jgi:hypothetical protein
LSLNTTLTGFPFPLYLHLKLDPTSSFFFFWGGMFVSTAVQSSSMLHGTHFSLGPTRLRPDFETKFLFDTNGTWL